MTRDPFARSDIGRRAMLGFLGSCAVGALSACATGQRVVVAQSPTPAPEATMATTAREQTITAATPGGQPSAPRSTLHPTPALGTTATPTPAAASGEVSHASIAPPPTSVSIGTPGGITRAPLPRGTIWALPGKGNLMALTIDDGTDARVVKAYLDLAEATGLRLTFFINGVNPSWTHYAAQLRRLTEAGQVFLANHTWSHPDLTKLTAQQIAADVRRNETFLRNTFGVSGRPFMRPPYGYHNARTDAVLADLGYPVVTMWLGSLGDSTPIKPERIVSLAQQWMLPQHIVIGHANHPNVIQVMDTLMAIIEQRGLTPVHLGDVYRVV